MPSSMWYLLLQLATTRLQLHFAHPRSISISYGHRNELKTRGLDETWTRTRWIRFVETDFPFILLLVEAVSRSALILKNIKPLNEPSQHSYAIAYHKRWKIYRNKYCNVCERVCCSDIRHMYVLADQCTHYSLLTTHTRRRRALRSGKNVEKGERTNL